VSNTEAPRHWRLKNQRYRLIGEKCPNENCGEKIFPPRDICPCCKGEVHSANNQLEFSGKGEVYSSTTVYDAPSGFEENTPYKIALVKLEEGPLVTAQLTDLDPNESIEIGTPVEMVTRRLRSDGDERGMLVYGYKFRPRMKSKLDIQNEQGTIYEALPENNQ
jgi:uncharacterized OB-fold protein